MSLNLSKTVRMYGSICVSDIIEACNSGHPAFTKAANGKVYTNVTVFINPEKDQYKNDASLLISAKDHPKVYIGNLRFADEEVPESVVNEFGQVLESFQNTYESNPESNEDSNT